jgi:hypothetical protein
MSSASVGKAGSAAIGDRLLACVVEHGSAAHPYPRSDALLRGPHASRNLSDAVHFLCMLHGRHPGVVDHAANRCLEPETRAWFNSNTAAFAEERSFLARLSFAVGPIPSTPGAGDTESTVLGQRHAIEMLAQSERRGCALGAAFAVVVDWGTIRVVLDAAAQRFGLDAPVSRLCTTGEIGSLADASVTTPSHERALLFGADQIVLQHHGLWNLLEARQQARGDS